MIYFVGNDNSNIFALFDPSQFSLRSLSPVKKVKEKDSLFSSCM